VLRYPRAKGTVHNRRSQRQLDTVAPPTAVAPPATGYNGSSIVLLNLKSIIYFSKIRKNNIKISVFLRSQSVVNSKWAKSNGPARAQS
jgi:hypothetical protein